MSTKALEGRRVGGGPESFMNCIFFCKVLSSFKTKFQFSWDFQKKFRGIGNLVRGSLVEEILQKIFSTFCRMFKILETLQNSEDA